MTDLERLLIERSCSNLVIQLSYAHDTPDNPGPILDCWTDNGVWESPSGRIEGKDPLRALLAGVAPGLARHYATGIWVNVINSEQAEGRCRVIVYKAKAIREDGTGVIESPLLIADHFDRYVRTEQGWKIAHRKTPRFELHRLT